MTSQHGAWSQPGGGATAWGRACCPRQARCCSEQTRADRCKDHSGWPGSEAGPRSANTFPGPEGWEPCDASPGGSPCPTSTGPTCLSSSSAELRTQAPRQSWASIERLRFSPQTISRETGLGGGGCTAREARAADHPPAPRALPHPCAPQAGTRSAPGEPASSPRGPALQPHKGSSVGSAGMGGQPGSWVPGGCPCPTDAL